MKSPTLTKQFLVFLAAGLVLLASRYPAIAGGSNSAGPKLIHTEAVAQITITGLVYGGPVGCDPATGAGCTFYDLTATAAGRNFPLGAYTADFTVTVLLGAATPNGAHDSNGNPTGFCYPELGTEADVFTDGSILTTDFQGLTCCANAICTGGLPALNHDSSVITGATGRLKGASGGTTWSDNFATPTGPLLMHAEGVLQLPGVSD